MQKVFWPLMDQARPTNAAAPPRRPVNLRSLTVGLAGVLLICTLTPYNNYVLKNTDFVGNHLPASLLMFYLLIVLLINAPLRRWLPRRALSGPELAVAIGMTLVGCALPSVGIMRYLPGHLVAPFTHAVENRGLADLLEQLDLPDWMWPTMQETDPVERGRDPVVRDFFGRVYVEDPTFTNRLLAVPWRAWLTPALTWGIFFAALFAAVICLSVIFRRQWVENERLSFPLATVYLSLIEPPEAGRVLNRLLASRPFWLAFAAVFILHGLNALHVYLPKYWPQIPLQYNMSAVLSEEPWQYTQGWFKVSHVYFTIIGIMFFVQARIAFSLWFFFVLMQVVRMIYGMRQMEYTEGMDQDQTIGAMMVVGTTALWIARKHLSMVVAQMFRGVRPGEPEGRYLPHALAGWGLVVCLIVLVWWLVAAGATLAGALVIVALLMLIYVVLARVVAETGLLYVLLPTDLNRPWVYAGDLSGGSVRTSLQSNFLGQYFYGMLTHDTREASPVYVTHALRVADEQAYPSARNWRGTASFAITLFLALMLAFFVAGASMLFTHYSYAATLDQNPDSPIIWWASYTMPRMIGLEGTQRYVPPQTGPVESHSRVGHLLFGAGFTGFLSFMNLRFAAWPLHPVGFLLVATWGLRRTWFSIFLGWLAKAVILRYGGSRLFAACRPFFLGMIFGEAAAVAFWLTISLCLSSFGMEFHSIRLLPE